ncbi:MAG: Crp/Fnr family transcriptional regulator [Desulfocapsaceae bacterium]|nr:Crp/Fnr family transcriptional regulator [Desulfocapsaceae bacterium]
MMENSTLKETIGKSSLFYGLPPEQIDLIVGIIVRKQYNRGETIFFEGDKGSGFYMVDSGKVKIYKMSFSGKEQILHIFGPGEPFGEVPVFHGQPFPATAEVLVKSSLLFFPRDKFIQLVHDMPSIALNMLAVLSMRLRRFASQIESLSLKEVPARLAGYLLYLSEEQGGTDTVALEISKGQLASLLGTIPETLSRIFAKMSEEGLIVVEGRNIRILDRESLADR